ncbi:MULTISPECIES: DUF2309 domain-containing protein [unclassified Thioalkalivibrio]|uniref:DUF2309 domain-containing protein n=1 Tax=unclassified Thioalkalivibrio TaxID=2621013 RepID=UPI00037016A9|nr:MULTISPECIES: DUF2309 domain-containing protein [unclassified Thioalkalivibrio]
MTLSLGRQLKIRSMVHMAAEPIPNFWPMRTFIHHNPLHGLEDHPFPEAIERGRALFHGRGFLARADYQWLLADGRIDPDALDTAIDRALGGYPALQATGGHALIHTLLTRCREPARRPCVLAAAEDVAAILAGGVPSAGDGVDVERIEDILRRAFPPERPLYEALDHLYDTRIAETLDELLIKTCLDFFDEGQSAWPMPGREQGLFAAWSQLAQRNLRLFLRGLHIKKILDQSDTPEGIIAFVLDELGIPEPSWPGLIVRELTHLHGWAGFIRWRERAPRYHWAREYPADLVDFLAIRLVLALSLVREHARRRRMPRNRFELEARITERPAESFLRHELFTGAVLPTRAESVEDAVARGRPAEIARLIGAYIPEKRQAEAGTQSRALEELAQRAGTPNAFRGLSPGCLAEVLTELEAFERREGMIWLEAMETTYRRALLSRLHPTPAPPREKRPFAQMLFCIDVRSERIRRQLETLGDYQTYGIAGFFGVPVSFIALGKGSEDHLCPVLLTPKNLVLEVTTGAEKLETDLYSSAEHLLHDLKHSVLSPYFTVEAIGLLFGFDMVGKTLAPRLYNRWRHRIESDKPSTRLLVDKLTREQADSVVRALQRVIIVEAIHKEFGIERESITDAIIRELREAALGRHTGQTHFAQAFALGKRAEADFIQTLQQRYRINRSYAQMQLERLGRIGFSLDEQTYFVAQALRSIGLTEHFSRFIILTGHGSQSHNNPYESALDCGACGGSHGLVSARVLAHMGNKPEVRRRLRHEGIHIPDDAWFLPAFHNTTSDAIELHDLDLLPASHLVYLERLRNGLQAARRRTAAERLQTLPPEGGPELEPIQAARMAQRNTVDWTQVRPEWGLARNAGFIIGRRHLTEGSDLDGRTFLHSYDYRLDPRGRLLANILTGPLVVAQWINMEHYFSTVDNEHYGSGSKVYHNVACRLGVITGNLSDLRTGLPAQTVLRDGRPYHDPIRLLAVIEAPFEQARAAINGVAKVRSLVTNGWILVVILDPETHRIHRFADGQWLEEPLAGAAHVQTDPTAAEETRA